MNTTVCRVPWTRLFSIVMLAGMALLATCLLHAQALRSSTDTSQDVQQLRVTVQNLQSRVSHLEGERMLASAEPTTPAAYAPSEQMLKGRLTCAALAAGTYKCGKNQPMWSCTMQCAQGSHYALQSGNGTYAINGNPSQLTALAAENVVVTGTVTGAGINADSIAKQR
jgi:predicted component of type VI protein secretion system